MPVLIINTDGGARGNPGPGASAFVAKINGKIIFQSAKYLGQTTNNKAEYYGVMLALKWLGSYANQEISKVEFLLDSELVVKQLNGSFKIKNKDLKTLSLAIKKLEEPWSNKIYYSYVPRKKNKQADVLVNNILDEN